MKLTKISACSIITDKESKYEYLAFKTDEKTGCSVAIPISLEGDTVGLRRVEQGMPKVFKEFPLIGSKETGYNFVFTSRYFYPNETRSNLLLNMIEGR